MRTWESGRVAVCLSSGRRGWMRLACPKWFHACENEETQRAPRKPSLRRLTCDSIPLMILYGHAMIPALARMISSRCSCSMMV